MLNSYKSSKIQSVSCAQDIPLCSADITQTYPTMLDKSISCNNGGHSNNKK